MQAASFRLWMTLSILSLSSVVSGSDLLHAETPPDDSVAIVGARIFDGRQMLAPASVVVEGGVITYIGVNAPAASERTIDAAGMTLMPGLIDAHTHVYDANALVDALRFGVTTELDMFSTMPTGELGSSYRRQAAPSQADLFSAGILATAPCGHGTEYGSPIPTISDPGEAERFVEQRLSEGSDYIKIVYDPQSSRFPSISRETLAALIRAAHRRDMKAIVHAPRLEAARQAVLAGADGLAHIVADLPVDRDFVDAIKASGAFVTPTLSVIAAATGNPTAGALLSDPRLAPILSEDQRTALNRVFPMGGAPVFNFEVAKENVRRLHQAGVPILAGTDAPNPGVAHGASLHYELELLVASGMSPIEALKSATAVPAQAFALHGRGLIEPGARADILLIESDPLEDITNTRRIAEVLKSGRQIVGEALREGPN